MPLLAHISLAAPYLPQLVSKFQSLQYVCLLALSTPLVHTALLAPIQIRLLWHVFVSYGNYISLLWKPYPLYGTYSPFTTNKFIFHGKHIRLIRTKPPMTQTCLPRQLYSPFKAQIASYGTYSALHKSPHMRHIRLSRPTMPSMGKICLSWQTLAIIWWIIVKTLAILIMAKHDLVVAYFRNKQQPPYIGGFIYCPNNGTISKILPLRAERTKSRWQNIHTLPK